MAGDARGWWRVARVGVGVEVRLTGPESGDSDCFPVPPLFVLGCTQVVALGAPIVAPSSSAFRGAAPGAVTERFAFIRILENFIGASPPLLLVIGALTCAPRWSHIMA